MEGWREGNPGDHPLPIQRLSESLARRPEVWFGFWVAIVYAAILLPRILLHTCWRDEFQAWMLATDGSPSLATLWTRMGYEGHPIGWFALLRIAGAIWPNPVAMKLLHAAIATAVVFVVAACAPANRRTRMLLCCGYFFAFEYAVISRDYSLGVLPLFAFAALRTWRPAAFIAQAFCVALAAQANIHSAILAIALALWTGLRWLREGRPSAGRFAFAVAIVSVSLAFATLQLAGAEDRDFFPAAYEPSFERLSTMFGGIWRGFVPIPSTKRDWWNSNFAEQFSFGITTGHAMAIAGGALLLATIWTLPRRRDVRLLWIVGVAILCTFGTLRYPGWLRHFGHFYILFLLAWWLGQDTLEERDAAGAPREAAVRFLLIAQALAGVLASAADLVLPMSSSDAVARYLRVQFPNAIIIGHVDFEVSAVAGALGQSVYYPTKDRWGSYLIWNKQPERELTPFDFTELAERFSAEMPGRPVIVVLSEDALPGPDFRHFRSVAKFYDSTIRSEQYTLYRYDAAPRVDPATTRP